MEDNGSTESLARSIPWVLWLIWKNINSLLYAETQVSVVRSLSEMMVEVEQWFLLNKPQLRTTEERARMDNSDKWCPPDNGVIKCNIHLNWRNASMHSGVAWIARDQAGNVYHHARDAIVHAPDRMVAEFGCVIWALTCLRDLGVQKVIMASDYYEVVKAIKVPYQWPRYRDLLQQIMGFKGTFDSLEFEGEKVVANGVARDIAKSVLRDGCFQSYLAMGGPSWLHDRIARDAVRSDV
ncbi:hypothetical protein DY000_02053490 [Brassica cretica]|uniref:RNase H type-1 domain-containing protein n=1 Tax=Brassica cretica TaxID=69181 RepID=A0ABQ7A8P9_BRACR|nr:hypothetical protein DY000_02053490 [Brassica cretica]